MNYARVYEQLIEKRRRIPLSKNEGYCERHHYIPRCVGGGNESWNIVNLTAKEHFIAHHLLCKIHPSNVKLLNAFIAMCTKTTHQRRHIHISAKRYAQLKREYGEARRRMYKLMPEDARAQRRQNIKAGCARRTPEQKARIKSKRAKYFATLTAEEKEFIAAKRRRTVASRSKDAQLRISERISKAHRKLSEDDELRVISEYRNGKTALEISSEPWCSLSREGVNYLLRRRGIKTHIQSRWDGLTEKICTDFRQGRFSTRQALMQLTAVNTRLKPKTVSFGIIQAAIGTAVSITRL